MRRTNLSRVLIALGLPAALLTALLSGATVQAEIVTVPLPGAIGAYSGTMSRTLTFDLGMSFDSIASVSVRLAGTIVPGMGQGDGVEMPADHFFVWPANMSAFMHPDEPGLWLASCGHSGTFDETVVFHRASYATWQFILDGQGEVVIALSPAIVIGGFMITPPSAQIQSAELIIEAVTSPIFIYCPNDTVIPINHSADPDSLDLHASASGGCQDYPSITYSDSFQPGGIIRTWIASDTCGATDSCIQHIGQGTPTDVGDDPDPIARDFALAQNYPNPFNPTTTIRYVLPSRSFVTVEVFSMLGRKVKTLVNRSEPAGTHKVKWDGTDDAGRSVASGIYLYRLQAGGDVLARKMLLMK